MLPSPHYFERRHAIPPSQGSSSSQKVGQLQDLRQGHLLRQSKPSRKAVLAPLRHRVAFSRTRSKDENE